jgi:hypothetical protein
VPEGPYISRYIKRRATKRVGCVRIHAEESRGTDRDSTRASAHQRKPKWKTPLSVFAGRSRPRNRAFRKPFIETIAYDETSITAACYLCNTHPKTRCTTLFEAVPLLRVHFPSVIVSVRRRGASRSRPVTVVRLSPSRSCGWVRWRDAAERRVEGTRGPTPRVFHPADPEPSLLEQLGGLT